MNQRSVILIVLALVLGVSGCSSFGFEGDVTAEVDPPALYLHNQTNRTIYYFAGDEHDLARIEVDLSDYEDWPTVAPRQTAEIPYENLVSYDKGDTRAWIYWTTEQGDNASLKVSLE